MTNQIIPTQGKLFGVSEIELFYKHPRNSKDFPQITSSQTGFDLISSTWLGNERFKEGFNILLLNRANRVIGIVHVAKEEIQMKPKALVKEVLSAALKASASGIILTSTCHQLYPKPTTEQQQLVGQCSKGAKVIDLVVLDYLICSTTDYYSFADNGKLRD